jgi:hypothetical protein
MSTPGKGNMLIDNNFNPTSTGLSTINIGTEARKPPRKKGPGVPLGKKKDKTFVNAAQ